MRQPRGARIHTAFCDWNNAFEAPSPQPPEATEPQPQPRSTANLSPSVLLTSRQREVRHVGAEDKSQPTCLTSTRRRGATCKGPSGSRGTQVNETGCDWGNGERGASELKSVKQMGCYWRSRRVVSIRARGHRGSVGRGTKQRSIQCFGPRVILEPRQDVHFASRPRCPRR